ncbi:MAG TPA: hypothetical protein P5262_04220 [Candidatus Moranbacteria bacterium]|nr:hypothetical protein [Candidatus Moranbacteria bacterium]
MKIKNKISFRAFAVFFSLALILVPFVSSAEWEWRYLAPGSGNYSTSGWNPGYLSYFGLPGGSVTGIVVGILQWILYLFGFLGILGFVISGILYLLSAGDDDQMKRAKNAMSYSIIGIIVGLSGVVLIKTVYLILSAGLYF